MAFVAASVAGSTALSAIGSGFASSSASSAQRSASKRAIRSNEILTREERARQDRLLAEQRADFAPWRETGQEALRTIYDGIRTGTYDPPVFDPDEINLQQDPGYQFRLDEGERAMQRTASARGNLLSGQQIREALRYSQGVASQEYQNAYARYADQWAREADRRQNRYRMLNELSGQGLSAASRQSTATANNALTSSNLTSSQINRTQDALMSAGRAEAEGYAGMATTLNQGIDNWLTYRSMRPSTSGTATNTGNSFALPAARQRQWAGSGITD